MGIALSQKIQQSQKVTLTPSLKKSIDLLQLSRYELINKIHQEIEDNPFIEKEEDYDITSSIDEEFSYEIESKKTLRDILLDQINDLNIDIISSQQFKSRDYEREKILLHFKEEERENQALEEYVKSKLNVLKE